MNFSKDFQYIDQNQQLRDYCDAIKDADHCAIDTEFVRESTYYPILSLIQIASGEHQACIDPLAITDFEPLKSILVKPELLKIFHSPSQDLEILYQNFAEVPQPIFDTQLAAAVLGYNHQISYADLVQQVTGVELEKKFTRADWSRRPLSDGELDYAMDDVRYLIPVYQCMKSELETRNRLHWLEKDLNTMSSAQTYSVDESSLWKKLKGVQKLKGVRLQIASDLCRWREDLARHSNKPRRWMAKDDLLIEIARQKPADLAALADIPELNDKMLKRHGEKLLSIVKAAGNIPSDQWPRHDKMKNLSTSQMALGDCLMALCRIIADENKIALATLATRKDIDTLVLHQKNSRLTQGWRFSMAGEQLLNFIHGQSSLSVNNDRIKLTTE
ncbi:MAG: ribonuclease D [Pseudomonadota bacterium]